MFQEIAMSEMSGYSVKQKIEELGIPLADVARSLGISPQTLQKRLAVDDIKVGVLSEIANAINKSVYFFFEGSNVSLQNQVNDNKARHNRQNLNAGIQTRVSKSSDYVNELEYRLNQAENQVREKDQIIADLRDSIQLYKKLLGHTSTH